MVKLYELNRETASGELTKSLAQSLKNGLFAPTEKKFNAMEEEISLLKQTIKLDAEKLALELNEKFSYLEKEYVLLKKLLRISITLSITSLAVIIATLFFLFKWY
ncbi:hypothetical protein [Desulfoscipio gibsoniae]|uniref:Uncharacterized protein n=1 Tax=Desulfoscipio gibsoniae DSM 7213 TaxID=767817 RepID=R4KMB0_9FIRM|nr:hypothetical protein [Desulfoscipio gibsoniae]AGL02692.1 hypothetical protein Desgi_3347 [Desulfoscipio gibsoniae DSM 7213]